MIDIAPFLSRYSRDKATWNETTSLRAAELIASLADAEIDWDDDAGEEWSSVLTAERAIAYVSMVGPLVFIVEDVAMSLDEVSERSLNAVPIPSLDASVLQCEERALTEAFGPTAVGSRAVDPACFSAQDLWFATI